MNEHGWNRHKQVGTLQQQRRQAFTDKVFAKPSAVLSHVVHHRENPPFMADGQADVAPTYWHFGDYLKKTFPSSLTMFRCRRTAT